jgi:hypothetical protein
VIVSAATVAGEFITATATDPNGNTSEFSLAFDTATHRGGPSGGASIAAAMPSSPTSPPGLSARQVRPLLSEAIRRWKLIGADARTLRGFQVRIADLPDATVSRVAGKTIWIDRDAAGWGWFVDPTPRNDSEFTSAGDQGEQGRVDLLTVLFKGIGQSLGFEQLSGTSLPDAFVPGRRSVG